MVEIINGIIDPQRSLRDAVEQREGAADKTSKHTHTHAQFVTQLLKPLQLPYERYLDKF